MEGERCKWCPDYLLRFYIQCVDRLLIPVFSLNWLTFNLYLWVRVSAHLVSIHGSTLGKKVSIYDNFNLPFLRVNWYKIAFKSLFKFVSHIIDTRNNFWEALCSKAYFVQYLERDQQCEKVVTFLNDFG